MRRKVEAVKFAGFIVGSILMASLYARADESFATLDIDGTSYSHVTVTLVTPTDVYFTYQGGIRNLKLKDLSPALQQHFHYDPAQANTAEQAQVSASARYYQSVAKTPGYASTPAATPAADDSLVGALLPKLPGHLVSKIYLDGFLIFSLVFFLSNVASFISGRRSSRSRQRLEHRLETLALIDLDNSAARQITSGSRRF